MTLFIVLFILFCCVYINYFRVIHGNYPRLFWGLFHDDVIEWKHIPRYWPFLRGIHGSPVNSPHKGQWREALIFSLICVWIDDWGAGDLRRHRSHVMSTHWGWVTHICVSKLTIIASDNGLSPGRRQAIIWTNAGILSIGPLGTNFSEILIEN